MMTATKVATTAATAPRAASAPFHGGAKAAPECGASFASRGGSVIPSVS